MPSWFHVVRLKAIKFDDNTANWRDAGMFKVAHNANKVVSVAGSVPFELSLSQA